MPIKHDLPVAFAELGIEVGLLKALAKIGFKEPTEIQRRLIPLVLAGNDVLGQARTGTGKTAAFGLPILQQLDPHQGLQALCMVPTRELAVQVAAELLRLSQFTDLRCVPVYGGERISAQMHHLGRKPHFVVGTPGRLMDLMERRLLDISLLRFVVLDEVDRMLDIGFRDDIRHILGHVRSPHQTVLVSATLDDEIKRLAAKYMHEAIELDVSRDQITVDEIEQRYCTVEPFDKYRLLRIVLEEEKPPLVIVFTNTKHAARKLAKKLHADGIIAREIHGDLDQKKRDRVMDSFRKHKIQVLVATDLASRGIDVSAISHIINYDIPPDPQVYVHRIGRTARMGAKGKAFTFVTKEQGKELTAVEKLVNQELKSQHFERFTPRTSRDGFDDGQRRPEPSARSAPTPPAPQVATSTKPKTLAGKFPVRRRRKL